VTTNHATFSGLQPAHDLWFAQRRKSMSNAIIWSARGDPAAGHGPPTEGGRKEKEGIAPE